MSVYVVHVPDRTDGGIHVFGHRDDAEAFRDAVMLNSTAEAILSREEVCDHATARELIETEAAS